MAEYIDRNRLIKKFCNHCYFDVGEKNCAEDCYDMKIIKSLPIEDVQPVKHGEWLEREQVADIQIDEWQSCRCSVCKKYHTTPFLYYFNNYNYCPNCGTKMDGEDDV